MKRMMTVLLCLLLCGCQSAAQPDPQPVESLAPAQLVSEQVLHGESGDIHYSYQLPEGYSENGSYPMMVVMPGYDMMWFGEDSSGANLDWQGFRCWSEQEDDMIVVSAQLTDWGEISQAQETYDALYAAHQEADLDEAQIDALLQIQTPDDAYFAEHDAGGYYHAAANIVFDDADVLSWILSHHK